MPHHDTASEQKAFTLLDTTTDTPAFGLECQPATNGAFYFLASVRGEKDWRSLDLNESVCVRDNFGTIYRMVRVR